MRKLLVLSLLVTLFAGTSFGQVPGYMGKRFSLGYTLEISPIGLNPVLDANDKVNADGKTVSLFSYAVRNGGCLNFAVGRSTSIFASFDYRNLSMRGDQNSVTYDIFGNVIGSTPVFYTAGVYMFKFGFESYVMGYLAPHGAHTGLALAMMSVSPSTSVKGMTVDGFTTAGLSYSAGYNKIFYDCLLLDLGICVTAMIPPGNGTASAGNVDNSARMKLYKNLAFTNLITAKIGVRYLLF